jgi:hypothetical protein
MIKEIQERDEGKYIFKSPSSPRKCEAKARTPWKSRTSVLYTKTRKQTRALHRVKKC